MNHIAAIHVLKSQCKLVEDDYRALLIALTGLDSCKRMSPAQLAAVRTHLQNLAVKLGVAKPAPAPQAGTAQFTRRRIPAKRSSSDAQDERWAKARTLWSQLARAGAVRVDSDAALLAYVKRQTKMDAWRFLNSYQINSVVESLKMWAARLGVGVPAVAGVPD
jgi:phage gp16-like protein